MAKREKIAISIDNDVLRAAERLRRETGESRSAVFERALVAYLEGRRRVAEVGRYLDGYRRAPESKAEISGALAAALAALAAEPWE